MQSDEDCEHMLQRTKLLHQVIDMHKQVFETRLAAAQSVTTLMLNLGGMDRSDRDHMITHIKTIFDQFNDACEDAHDLILPQEAQAASRKRIRDAE